MSEAFVVGVTFSVTYALIFGYAAYLHVRRRKTER